MNNSDKKRLIDISKENETIKQAFLAVKDELDDHRRSINENSQEIEANYEFLFSIEKKLNKLAESVDELNFFMKEFTEQEALKSSLYLSKTEQKVFLKLYTTEEGSLSCEEIAEQLRSSAVVVKACIKSMIKKNVPIFTERQQSELVYRLDPHFRAVQAKRGIVKLDQTLIHEWV